MTGSQLKLTIFLPEGVQFAIPLAGLVSRSLAFLIDVCIISALSTAFQMLTLFVRAAQQDFGAGLLIVLYVSIWILYGILCEYFWFGQTLGKWLLGIRVIDASGLRLQLHQIVVRNLIRTLDLFPLMGLAGGLSMICTRGLQRLGDLAAGTVVVRHLSRTNANEGDFSPGRYNSFFQHQLACARLRQRVSPEAAAIALEAIRRRNCLADRARVVLFDKLADFFQSLAPFPPEAADQLSSEQYVRNVVEILYWRPAIHIKAPDAVTPAAL